MVCFNVLLPCQCIAIISTNLYIMQELKIIIHSSLVCINKMFFQELYSVQEWKHQYLSVKTMLEMEMQTAMLKFF